MANEIEGKCHDLMKEIEDNFRERAWSMDEWFAVKRLLMPLMEDKERLDWVEKMGVERCIIIDSHAPAGLVSNWWWTVKAQGLGPLAQNGTHIPTFRLALDEARAKHPR